MSGARLWQQVEGALVFTAALAIYGAGDQPFAWWLTLILFFAPDLSFLGYLAGPKVGAVGYNAVHIYGFGAVLMAVGWLMAMPVVVELGALWLGHSGFDRMLGYGLKLSSGFQDTHLGRIGR